MKRAKQKATNGLVWVLLIGVFVVAVDQVTKWLAISYLEGQPPVEVVGDWLQLTFVRNPGAAFSIGTQYTWIFALAACAVSIGIVVYSRKVTSTLWLIAMGLLLGGAVGNLVDRVTQPPSAGQGHVVDWLELPNWPVFNVADMAVVGGAILMVVLSLLGVEPSPTVETDTEIEPSEPGAAIEGDPEVNPGPTAELGEPGHPEEGGEPGHTAEVGEYDEESVRGS